MTIWTENSQILKTVIRPNTIYVIQLQWQPPIDRLFSPTTLFTEWLLEAFLEQSTL